MAEEKQISKILIKYLRIAILSLLLTLLSLFYTYNSSTSTICNDLNSNSLALAYEHNSNTTNRGFPLVVREEVGKYTKSGNEYFENIYWSKFLLNYLFWFFAVYLIVTLYEFNGLEIKIKLKKKSLDV